jgi:hypothetical protein
VTPPLLAGVYSSRNTQRVERVVRPATAAGWDVALWSLDDVPASLEEATRGRGPGSRLQLLNRLLEHARGLPRWVVLCDDDVGFVRGDVVRLVSESEAAGFGLSQPAHAEGSHVSHGHTRAVARSRARSVPFIEAGPVSVLSPTWCGRVLPLPEWRGMGWGLELEWMDLRDEGCILGIVDRVQYLHLDPIGRTYDESAERERMRADLDARGIADLSDFQTTLETWRPWSRRPPWSGGSAG